MQMDGDLTWLRIWDIPQSTTTSLAGVRRNVKEANPNAIILAEHYGDPKSWLKGDQWDTVMNYDAFMDYHMVPLRC